MLHRRFKSAKCKTALKLTVSRIKLLKNKREAQVNQLKKELALLLGAGQDHTAMIRVEHVIREQKTIAAYELVEIYCDLIAARLTIIDSQKNCPIDLKEAISSTIFASPRCADVPELADVRKHFTRKYGKDFVSAAVELRPDCGVSRLLVEKLSAKAPDAHAKLKILSSIADQHNVQWDSNSLAEKNMKLPEDRLGGPNKVEQSKLQEEIPGSKVTCDLDSSSSHPPQGAPTRNSTSSAPETSGPGMQATVKQQKRLHEGEKKSGLSQPDGQNWPMDFKDATAAAQVAAESAELASFAARAAARLSSQGRMASSRMVDHSENDEDEEHAGLAERFSNLKSSSLAQTQLSSPISDTKSNDGSSPAEETHPDESASDNGALSATFDDSDGSHSHHDDDRQPHDDLDPLLHLLQHGVSEGVEAELGSSKDPKLQASQSSVVEDDVQDDRRLNFGNLTGGLRNKVAKQQPYFHGDQPEKLKQEPNKVSSIVASSTIYDDDDDADDDDDHSEQVPQVGLSPVRKQNHLPHHIPNTITSHRTTLIPANKLKPKASAENEVEDKDDGTVAEPSASATGSSCSDDGASMGNGSATRASHVHPNLPDYDDFAAYFMTLRDHRDDHT